MLSHEGVGASHELPLHYQCQGIVFRENVNGDLECYLKSDDLSSLKHYDDRYVRDNLAAPEVAGDFVRATDFKRISTLPVSDTGLRLWFFRGRASQVFAYPAPSPPPYLPTMDACQGFVATPYAEIEPVGQLVHDLGEWVPTADIHSTRARVRTRF